MTVLNYVRECRTAENHDILFLFSMKLRWESWLWNYLT